MEHRVGALESGFAVHEERIKTLENRGVTVDETMTLIVQYMARQEGREEQTAAIYKKAMFWIKLIGLLVAFATLSLAALEYLAHNQKIQDTVTHSLLHLHSQSKAVEAENSRQRDLGAAIPFNEEAYLGN